MDSAPLDQNTEDLSGAGAYWDSALPSGMTDEDRYPSPPFHDIMMYSSEEDPFSSSRFPRCEEFE